MSDWTQDHYVTRNSTTDDPSGYRVWLTCRCGWDSGTLVDGFMPTTHRAELEHYVSVAPLAEVEREAAARALEEAADEIFVPHNENRDMSDAFHRGADAVYDALRARAAEIRGWESK